MKTVSAGNDNFIHFADFLHPFLIDECLVKGSFIRLGLAVDEIIRRHNYPRAVSRLLAEQMVLACMLSVNLEESGSLTMQVKGGKGGPVNFMVVDVTGQGHIRGYAELAEDAAEKLAFWKRDEEPKFREIVGEGAYLAITMNTGPNSQQYQGIVELRGETLTEAVAEYFSQSEQISVSIKVAVAQKQRWYAGGIMLQRIPGQGGKKLTKKQMAEDEENWNRSKILMNSVKNEELLDAELPAQSLLLRLFNEDGVWVYEPIRLGAQCRCSRERIEDVLATFPNEELEEMKNDGVISVNCQFCNKTEVFRENDIKKLSKKKR